MTRHFFPASRAHHAYSMALDFGMEFEQRFGKWKPEGLIHLPSGTDYKLYVHADSLHLLEPKDGDKDEDGFVFCATTQAWWRECGEDDEGEKLHRAKLPEVSCPAKRNGKPFFWPEQEP